MLASCFGEVMVRAEEWRELCVLMAANSFVHQRKGLGQSSRYTQYTMRCVLYMLVAFSLRHSIGRQGLRSSTRNLNAPKPSGLRSSIYCSTPFRALADAFLSALSGTLPPKCGCPAISYQ